MYYESKNELNCNRFVDPNILGASRLVHSDLRIYRISPRHKKALKLFETYLAESRLVSSVCRDIVTDYPSCVEKIFYIH